MYNEYNRTASLKCLWSIIISNHSWGHLVARHPWPVITTTFTVTTLCSLGFLLFRSVSALMTCKQLEFGVVQCFTGCSMPQMNCGSPPLHFSNRTKSGETLIFKETRDTKILCSKEKMYSLRMLSDRFAGNLIKV